MPKRERRSTSLPPSSGQSTPVDMPCVCLQSGYLEQARKLADQAIQIFFEGGDLPRVSSRPKTKAGHYEAITGADTLVLALAELAERRRQKLRELNDLGWRDVGRFGSTFHRTPNLDRLAREGMRFTDAHAPGPLCHPSRYGLMTGRYPFRIDVSRWPKYPLIEEGQVTLASLLRGAGYTTAMVGKWHLGFAENGYDKALRGGPALCEAAVV